MIAARGVILSAIRSAEANALRRLDAVLQEKVQALRGSQGRRSDICIAGQRRVSCWSRQIVECGRMYAAS